MSAGLCPAWTGAGGAYDHFLTEHGSLEDLISSFCDDRNV